MPCLASSVSITGNTIRREAGTAAPVISLAGLTPAGPSPAPQYPSDVAISGNVIYQGTGDVGISVLSTAVLNITGNDIKLANGLVGPHAIKVARSASSEPLSSDVTIVANTLTGPWQIGVTLQGVAGAIFHKLLRDHSTTHRQEFSNRELRLDPTLKLPDITDNLEARLVLLERRLAERKAPMRIEKTGRGKFRLHIDRPFQLVTSTS